MENALPNLDEYRKTHPMDAQTVMKMGIDLCEELEQYRQTQEVHCDIKTTNILVTESGREGALGTDGRSLCAGTSDVPSSD